MKSTSSSIHTEIILSCFRPRGKESTEVQITQNKAKESENSYQKLKRSRWTGTRKHKVTKLKYFDGHGRLSQSEEGGCM